MPALLQARKQVLAQHGMAAEARRSELGRDQRSGRFHRAAYSEGIVPLCTTTRRRKTPSVPCWPNAKHFWPECSQPLDNAPCPACARRVDNAPLVHRLGPTERWKCFAISTLRSGMAPCAANSCRSELCSRSFCGADVREHRTGRPPRSYKSIIGRKTVARRTVTRHAIPGAAPPVRRGRPSCWRSLEHAPPPPAVSRCG
ncbi:hypothetical protein D3C80_1539710 [compost metagenome]